VLPQEGRKASADGGVETQVRIDTLLTGEEDFSLCPSRSQLSTCLSMVREIEETRLSPGRRVNGGVIRRLTSNRFPCVRSSKLVLSCTFGRLITFPFLPAVGGGEMAVIVIGPTT
jgi:hypothetical protein